MRKDNTLIIWKGDDVRRRKGDHKEQLKDKVERQGPGVPRGPGLHPPTGATQGQLEPLADECPQTDHRHYH